MTKIYFIPCLVFVYSSWLIAPQTLGISELKSFGCIFCCTIWPLVLSS